MQMTAFWDVVPCSLKAGRRFIALMMEAECTSETLVDIQLRTRQYISEDSELSTSLPSTTPTL
jgi:hypothetical protein